MSRSGIFATVGIILAVAVIAAGMWWDHQRNEAIVSRAASSSSLSDRAPTPLVPVEPDVSAFTPMADTVARLNNNSEPLTIAVIGDSTGNDGNEWVALFAAKLNTDKGRTVTTHTWSNDQTGYVRERTLSGSGEPVTIWNFSAPGYPSKYSIQHLDVGVPSSPDLVFINHGHNEQPTQVAGWIDSLIERVAPLREPAPSLALIVQNPRTDDGAEASTRIADQVREVGKEYPQTVVIDVFEAFTATGDVASLLHTDGLHPNPAGSRVWAEAVAASLGL